MVPSIGLSVLSGDDLMIEFWQLETFAQASRDLHANNIYLLCIVGCGGNLNADHRLNKRRRSFERALC